MYTLFIFKLGMGVVMAMIGGGGEKGWCDLVVGQLGPRLCIERVLAQGEVTTSNDGWEVGIGT